MLSHQRRGPKGAERNSSTMGGFLCASFVRSPKPPGRPGTRSVRLLLLDPTTQPSLLSCFFSNVAAAASSRTRGSSRALAAASSVCQEDVHRCLHSTALVGLRFERRGNCLRCVLSDGTAIAAGDPSSLEELNNNNARSDLPLPASSGLAAVATPTRLRRAIAVLGLTRDIRLKSWRTSCRTAGISRA